MRRLVRPLLYVGTVAIVIGLGRYHAQFIGHYVFHKSDRLPWSLTYATVLCVAAYAFGLPDLSRDRSAWSPAVSAAVSAALAISVVQLATASQLLPRFVVFASATLAVPWFAVCVRLADIGRTREEGRERVVLVAGRDEAATLEVDIRRNLERPASLVATISPEGAHAVGPRSRPLVETAVEQRGTVVVLDRTASIDKSIVAQAATLHEAGLRVRSLSLFYEEWLGKLPLSELERMSLMFDVGDLHRVRYGRVKRLLDVLVSLVGVVVLVPVLTAVVVGDMIGNRGPVFFRQPRVGKGSKEFQILKFRTMRSHPDSNEWTAEGDERITPFGKILRRTHIDELPQVVNILRGHQSLVGPRPEQPGYVAELREKIPFYDLRHLVRPGLTGWAQVKYDYGSSATDAIEKLQYEFYYLRHQSLSLDLRIVGRTLRSVIGRGGR